jgi:tRNA(Ile2)-agmatinylcytidine synthase
MLVGIDDTDSRTLGMCTTYIGVLIVEQVSPFAESITPYLLRLNPNVPFKTRGNAAVAFDIVLDSSRFESKVKEICYRIIEDFSVFSDDNTHPGVVFLSDDVAAEACDELKRFSSQAVRDFLAVEEVKAFLEEWEIEHRGYKLGRGLIGALAAVGLAYTGLPDYTYELVAYRMPSNWGRKRFLVEESVWRADAETYPLTWDTVDYCNQRIVCSPNGADPVLFGIRGSDTGAINHAFNIIRSEPVERCLLYITNQGTDMHILPGSISEVRDGRSYALEGTVVRAPQTMRGGHVFFSIEDCGCRIDCAAFEPTKNFRELIKQLAVGDVVCVYGSVKKGTVNVEKLRIESLSARRILKNPMCSCGRRMKSAGRGQGYRCRKCRRTSNVPDVIELPVMLEPGFYEAPPVARRHLAKPLVRYVDGDVKVYPSR